MQYIPRRIEKDIRRSLDNPKILMLLGARQSGKTTLINKIISEYGGNLLNMDIEADFARLESVRPLPPAESIKNLGGSRILAIDEAQRVPDIGRLTKGWYDAKIPTKIILLGSSSINLLAQAASDLTGRNEKYFLTPLLFSEVIQHQSWYSPSLPVTSLKSTLFSQVEALIFQLLDFGSYPEAVTTAEKQKYLLNLTSDYLLKDILSGSIINQPDAIKRLLLLLSYQTGSEVSVSELAATLNISRQTVEHYLDLLEKIFVIFRLPAFSRNPRKEIAKNKKIFFWDTGVMNALQNNFNPPTHRADIGRLWENWVIAEFAKRNLTGGQGSSLYFWRTQQGSEVDLIVKKGEQLEAYEIKWSPTKQRRLPSFTAQYNIPVKQINRQNVVDFLLN